MKAKELYKILSNTKIPCAYMVHTEKVSPPFLIYRGSGANNFKSDDEVYYTDYGYTIEYYFKEKDEEKEEAIEKVLNQNKIIWEKSEDIYIDSEKLFLIYYTI